jgi:hypothetical protein
MAMHTSGWDDTAKRIGYQKYLELHVAALNEVWRVRRGAAIDLVLDRGRRLTHAAGVPAAVRGVSARDASMICGRVIVGGASLAERLLDGTGESRHAGGDERG